MQIRVTMIEVEIRQAIAIYLENKYGVSVQADDLHIEVKSKQNYKSEWELASIRLDCVARPMSE